MPPAVSLQLAVAGVHNVRNALAALAVAASCGVISETALAALADYRGSARRFEWKGEAGGVVVIDDYAHHPTEVTATLAAARQRYPDRRIWAVFQPHTYSRTQRMLYQMGESFEAADEVIVLDIYAARELDDGSVNCRRACGCQPASCDPPYCRHCRRRSLPGGACARPATSCITLGAGDGYQVGERLLRRLRRGANAMSTCRRCPHSLGVEIGENVSLAPYTTHESGGTGRILCDRRDHGADDQGGALGACGAIPYYILGGGSNILIADAGIRGLVIYNRCRQVRVDEAPCCVFPLDDRPFLFAESGAAMAGAARTSIAAGLTGLEWAVSVPGTVGGAIVGNAGAHGMEIKDNLWNAMILDENDMVEEVPVGSA